MIKKKLLVTTSTFPRWQNDTDPPFVFELARRLTSHFEIIVLTPNYPGAKVREEMAGIQIYRFRYFLRKFEVLAGSVGILPTLKKNSLLYLLVPFFLLGELWALLKLIKKNRPDVIHAHWILPQGFIAALAKKDNRGTIYFNHPRRRYLWDAGEICNCPETICTAKRCADHSGQQKYQGYYCK